MDDLIRDLFDLQRFEGNAKLRALIEETQKRYSGELLEDDALDGIAAAGAIFAREEGSKNDV